MTCLFGAFILFDSGFDLFQDIRFEFLDLRVFRVAARMTSQTKGRGRPASHEVFLGALMATCAGNLLLDVSLVRKLDGLLNARNAPAGPVRPSRSCQSDCHD